MLHHKFFRVIILTAFAAYSAIIPGYGLKATPPPGIQNVQFQSKRELVRVTYDLIGNPEEVYRVKLQVNISEDSTFSPTAVTGEVGEGITPGQGKVIRWNVLQDFPNGFETENISFTVKAVQESNNGPWVVYAVNTALVTAIGVSILLLAGSGSAGDFPPPPQRP
ncbi:MAG: hypothetical protein K9N57_00110 [Candidatus Marinimicrobia bacterium]|nr:hypothetical protein [Candidatus Neomarinimicrobiota bacterium]